MYVAQMGIFIIESCITMTTAVFKCTLLQALVMCLEWLMFFMLESRIT